MLDTKVDTIKEEELSVESNDSYCQKPNEYKEYLDIQEIDEITERIENDGDQYYYSGLNEIKNI
jgi:hypothetical protein